MGELLSGEETISLHIFFENWLVLEYNRRYKTDLGVLDEIVLHATGDIINKWWNVYGGRTPTDKEQAERGFHDSCLVEVTQLYRNFLKSFRDLVMTGRTNLYVKYQRLLKHADADVTLDSTRQRFSAVADTYLRTAWETIETVPRGSALPPLEMLFDSSVPN